MHTRVDVFELAFEIVWFEIDELVFDIATGHETSDATSESRVDGSI